MVQAPVLTIDGPAGSGKGTVARALAAFLGWHLLDSGSLYRWVAVWAQERGLSLEPQGVSALLALIEEKSPLFPSLSIDDPQIRRVEVGHAASCLAQYEGVRAALLEEQRRYARQPGLVADGRDMGTVVFPHAFLKIFLEASSPVRAERLGVPLDVLEERDQRDRSRSCAPLLQAKDAMYIDCSTLSVSEVRDKIVHCIRVREGVIV